MTDITINLKDENEEKLEFDVELSDGDSQTESSLHSGLRRTKHVVSVLRKDYERLSGNKISPEELIEMSFQFLLAREPKESILSEFNLMLIGKYFPEFEDEIGKLVG